MRIRQMNWRGKTWHLWCNILSFKKNLKGKRKLKKQLKRLLVMTKVELKEKQIQRRIKVKQEERELPLLKTRMLLNQSLLNTLKYKRTRIVWSWREPLWRPQNKLRREAKSHQLQQQLSQVKPIRVLGANSKINLAIEPNSYWPNIRFWELQITH